MDALFSGMGENIGIFAALLFSAQGLAIWLWLLLPVALIAVPLMGIRPADAPQRTRIARGLLAALPAFWLAVCALTITFAYNEKFDRFLISEIVFWVFVGLTVVMILSGLAAIVLIRGWHRLTAAGLLVINLWVIATCAFLGAMIVAGVYL